MHTVKLVAYLVAEWGKLSSVLHAPVVRELDTIHEISEAGCKTGCSEKKEQLLAPMACALICNIVEHFFGTAVKIYSGLRSGKFIYQFQVGQKAFCVFRGKLFLQKLQ